MTTDQLRRRSPENPTGYLWKAPIPPSITPVKLHGDQGIHIHGQDSPKGPYPLCSYGCPLSIATTPSTIFDDGVSPEDDGRSTAQRANVNNKTENPIISETRAFTKNDPEECHNDHHAVGDQMPVTLSGHQEHSQQETLSSNPCPAPVSAEDFIWSSIPAVEEFKNDPAHEYWEWNSVTEQWCHTDEEGLTLSCPAMLD
ncbi:hypothetical protein CSIM01_10832 [Colletotrichum simmondsii]|uniref:Uncharacterized protein n=1 Tax=Colletotrichum simmondsii TaxID=703756 RepID=A0A135RMR5_9PEZI|nr:hypothetical protein CSIM01_10832 [Colletotrichum simmondsii]